jgi:hypothetical protein
MQALGGFSLKDRWDVDERYHRRDMPPTQQREVSPNIIRAWFDLIDLLKKVRNDLSLSAGVPIVEYLAS